MEPYKEKSAQLNHKQTNPQVFFLMENPESDKQETIHIFPLNKESVIIYQIKQKYTYFEADIRFKINDFEKEGNFPNCDATSKYK